MTKYPINIGSGNKYKAQTDYIGTGPYALNFVRSYNSNGASDGVLGNGWRHNYSRKLAFKTVSDDIGSPIGTVIMRGEAGVDYTFTDQTGSWESGSNVFITLDHINESFDRAWKVTLSDGTVEIYDTAGALRSIDRSDGNQITLIYSYGKLSEVTNQTGHSLTLGYATISSKDIHITSVTNHTGQTWVYAYDTNNNLASVTNPDSTVRTYHYEDPAFPNYLTGITDERNVRVETYGYNAEGRAVFSTMPGNVDRVDITYNTDGTRTVMGSRPGQVSTYGINVQNSKSLVTSIDGPGCSSCGIGNSTYLYNQVTNNLESKIVKGLTTEYGNYDAVGNPGFMTEAAGTPNARTTSYTYTGSDTNPGAGYRFRSRVATKTEPSIYAGASKVTTYTYDIYGNTTSITVNGFTPSGTPESRTTILAYNGPLHQLSSIDGPRAGTADTTNFNYYADDVAQGNNRARLQSVTGPLGIVLRSNIQYSATGKVLSEARPNGLDLTYTYYPGNDRLETLTQTAGGESRTTRWTYLATGKVETITLADGSAAATTLTFGYDSARRLEQITDGLGNFLRYQLDTEGNHEKEDIYDSGSVLRRSLTQTFDIYNQLDTFSQANEYADYNFSPDGTLGDVTDGNLSTTAYTYDNLKRLTRTTRDVGGSQPDTADTLIQYGYDVADRLTSVIDPNGNATSYVYDDLGNLITQTSPDTGTMAYQYDAAGNVIQLTDAKTQMFAYSYDALNRLTFLDAPGTADDITYDYDVCAGGQGRLCAVTYGAAGDGNDVAYAYNGFGEVTTHQDIGYAFDAAGRLAAMTYPSGNVVTYTYDAAGQVSGVDLATASGTQSLASGITYAPFGGVTAFAYGNGLPLSQQWDSAYRLTSQSAGDYSASYPIYDGNGNLTNRTMGLSNELYSYDALNQLDTASGGFGARDYDYDFNGNRTAVDRDGTLASYGYQPGSNILATETGWTYAHDANGNRTAKIDPGGLVPATTYAYTPYNRLVMVTTDAQVVGLYSYNGLGQRVAKATSDGTTTFVYDLAGQMVMETAANGETREYVYLNGQPLAMRHARMTPADLQEVVVDEDSIGVVQNGTWQARKGRRSYSNDFALSQGGTSSTVTYTPTLDGGVYDVYGWWPRIRKNSATVPVTIAHVGGASQRTVDQTTTGRDWVHLGKYIFAEGTAGSVTFSDANGAAAADAVRFVKVVEETPPTPVVELYFIHTDHLGTPQVLSDTSGQVVWRASYGPFGQTGINEDVDGDGTAVSFNLAFPGQYYDQETRLHYNWNRYMDPETGRYLTSDPIGLQGGLNTYAYVRANPLKFIDPLGLEIQGSWIQSPRFNLQDAGVDSWEFVSPSFSVWGYLRFIRLHGHASGFVNIDVKCTDDCKEWEVHDRISVSASGFFDIGPNLYATGAGMLGGPYVGGSVLIITAGAAALDAEYYFLSLAQEKAGPIISSLLANGPTLICLGSSGNAK